MRRKRRRKLDDYGSPVVPGGGSDAGGVYFIRCEANGWVYVGRSGSAVEMRWPYHRWALRADRHQCRSLQQDWNKFGESQFRFIVMMRFRRFYNCTDCRTEIRAVCRHHEARLILAYRQRGLCYNIRPLYPEKILSELELYTDR